MIALIENILLALTDAQFDKVLLLIERGFSTITSAVQAVFNILLPLVLAWVAWKCQRITQGQKTIEENQKSNRKALDENTQVSVKAFEAANSHNEKIAAVVEYVKPKLPE